MKYSMVVPRIRVSTLHPNGSRIGSATLPEAAPTYKKPNCYRSAESTGNFEIKLLYGNHFGDEY